MKQLATQNVQQLIRSVTSLIQKVIIEFVKLQPTRYSLTRLSISVDCIQYVLHACM